MKFKTTLANIEVPITPKQVAELFCDMTDEQQAEFFNSIYETVRQTWEHPLCFQLEAVNSCGKLTKGGRMVMGEIGNYSTELNTQ